jgi:hypothetical protein
LNFNAKNGELETLNIMAKNNQLPEKIQELLKKKGWTWPPDEKLKAQWDAAAKRLAGSLKVDNDNELLELLDGIRGMERVREQIELRCKNP